MGKPPRKQRASIDESFVPPSSTTLLCGRKEVSIEVPRSKSPSGNPTSLFQRINKDQLYLYHHHIDDVLLQKQPSVLEVILVASIPLLRMHTPPDNPGAGDSLYTQFLRFGGILSQFASTLWRSVSGKSFIRRALAIYCGESVSL